MTDAKEILVAAILALLLSLVPCALRCSADQLLAFHTAGCRPCAEMATVENLIRSEGLPLQVVTAPEVAKLYRVTRFPQYVYVCEAPAGRVVVGRIVGKCTAGQLRRLCVMPVAATVGAAARNAVRSLSGSPSVWEW